MIHLLPVTHRGSWSFRPLKSPRQPPAPKIRDGQQDFVPLSKPKLISPDMADRVRFSWDNIGDCLFSGGAAGGVGIIPNPDLSPFYLMGLLNSKFIEEHIRSHGTTFRGGYLNCEIRFLRNLPIPVLSSKSDHDLAEKIEAITNTIIKKKVTSHKAGLGDNELERLKREIESLETRIDSLVVQLYGT